MPVLYSLKIPTPGGMDRFLQTDYKYCVSLKLNNRWVNKFFTNKKAALSYKRWHDNLSPDRKQTLGIEGFRFITGDKILKLRRVNALLSQILG